MNSDQTHLASRGLHNIISTNVLPEDSGKNGAASIAYLQLGSGFQTRSCQQQATHARNRTTSSMRPALRALSCIFYLVSYGVVVH